MAALMLSGDLLLLELYYLKASSICSSLLMLAFSNSFASKSKSCTIKTWRIRGSPKRWCSSFVVIRLQSNYSTYHDFVFVLDVTEADFADLVLLLCVQPMTEHFHDERILVLFDFAM